jgi:hypothetical protein
MSMSIDESATEIFYAATSGSQAASGLTNRASTIRRVRRRTRSQHLEATTYHDLFGIAGQALNRRYQYSNKV